MAKWKSALAALLLLIAIAGIVSKEGSWRSPKLLRLSAAPGATAPSMREEQEKEHLHSDAVEKAIRTNHHNDSLKSDYVLTVVLFDPYCELHSGDLAIFLSMPHGAQVGVLRPKSTTRFCAERADWGSRLPQVHEYDASFGERDDAQNVLAALSGTLFFASALSFLTSSPMLSQRLHCGDRANMSGCVQGLQTKRRDLVVMIDASKMRLECGALISWLSRTLQAVPNKTVLIAALETKTSNALEFMEHWVRVVPFFDDAASVSREHALERLLKSAPEQKIADGVAPSYVSTQFFAGDLVAVHTLLKIVVAHQAVKRLPGLGIEPLLTRMLKIDPLVGMATGLANAKQHFLFNEMDVLLMRAPLQVDTCLDEMRTAMPAVCVDKVVETEPAGPTASVLGYLRSSKCSSRLTASAPHQPASCRRQFAFGKPAVVFNSSLHLSADSRQRLSKTLPSHIHSAWARWSDADPPAMLRAGQTVKNIAPALGPRPFCGGDMSREVTLVLTLAKGYTMKAIGSFVHTFVANNPVDCTSRDPVTVLVVLTTDPAWFSSLGPLPNVVFLPMRVWRRGVKKAPLAKCSIVVSRFPLILLTLMAIVEQWAPTYVLISDSRDVLFQSSVATAVRNMIRRQRGSHRSGGDQDFVALVLERLFLGSIDVTSFVPFLLNSLWVAETFSTSYAVAAQQAELELSRGSIPMPVPCAGMFLGTAAGIVSLLKLLISTMELRGCKSNDQGALVGLVLSGFGAARFPHEVWLLDPHDAPLTHQFASGREMRWSDRKLINCNNETYAVVHQLDRYPPAWAAVVGS